MKERQLGEIFKLGEKTYKVVEAHGKNPCHFCAFGNPANDDEASVCVYSNCERDQRTDCCDVRFKEVK